MHPRHCICALTLIGEYGCTVVRPIHTAWERVNSTSIQCFHEQSLTGICIFPVFYLLPMDHLCTNR